MRRRWVVIAVGLAAYWSVVGYEIADARRNTPSLCFPLEWNTPVVLTLPWSLVANQVGEGMRQRQRRVVYTVATTAGGLLNGLLFTLFVRWVTRPPRPVADVAHDYADGPDGTRRDGRSDPPEPLPMEPLASIRSRPTWVVGSPTAWRGAIGPEPGAVCIPFGFDLTGDGAGHFLLVSFSADGRYGADSWYPTLADAQTAAERQFGIRSDEWGPGEAE